MNSQEMYGFAGSLSRYSRISSGFAYTVSYTHLDVYKRQIQNLVITGSMITIIPLVVAFLLLQKYWQSGLAAGAVKE